MTAPSAVIAVIVASTVLSAQGGRSGTPQPPRIVHGKPLVQRIAQTDRAKMQHVERRHDGAAGGMDVMTLVSSDDMNANVIYMFRGEIPPKGGIGHHYHMRVEEMFIIFDNEAEFTIDGRTARLAGPVGAPVRSGHSHGIYNPTDKPTQWMNFGVSTVKGVGEVTRNLGDPSDDRVGVTVDPRPTFVTMRLDRRLLRPQHQMLGGTGTVQYRRALQAEDFFSNWAYVDHIVLPPGASIGRHRHTQVEEVFYVVSGEGTVELGSESAPFRAGAALPVLLDEVHGVRNTSSADLELMVMGVSMEKGKVD